MVMTMEVVSGNVNNCITGYDNNNENCGSTRNGNNNNGDSVNKSSNNKSSNNISLSQTTCRL